MMKRIKRTERKTRGMFVLVLLGVLTIGFGVWVAVASACPPPTLTGPQSPTNSTSVSFSYTDATSTSGHAFIQFLCSLDGAAYTACGTNPAAGFKSYSGVPAGSHTFSVKAAYVSETSAPTSYSWTIDVTAPTVVSINRTGTSPASAGPLGWKVTFSEPVSNVVAGDFGIVDGSGITGAPVMGAPSPNGGSAPQSTWNISATTTGVSGASPNNTIGLNLTSKGSIKDGAGNLLGATLPVVGQTYVYSTMAQPSVTLTVAGGPATGTVGAAFPVASITGTVSGRVGQDGTGKISFFAVGPQASAPSSCTGGSQIGSLVTEAAGNSYNPSSGFTPGSIGNYWLYAVYGGDSHNLSATGTCAPGNGQEIQVGKATPSLMTTPTPSSVAIGSTATDKATLSGGYGTLSGTISYKLYTPTDTHCTGTPLTAASSTVNGAGTYQSGSVSPTAVGTWNWIAAYSGNSNNNAVTGNCSSESLTVTKAQPVLSTSATGSVTVGGSISDTAALTGLFHPDGTGTITFKLYSNGSCSGTPLYTHTSSGVSANGNVGSGAFTTTAASDGDYWVASYAGDSLNKPVVGTCGAPGETSVVNRAQPGLSTHASGPVTVGGQISDTATLSGLVSADGSGFVVFVLYPSSACNGLPLYASVSPPVSGNGNFGSGNYTTTTASSGDYWAAIYTGDGNNKPATEGCGGANEISVVNKATPAISTTLSAASITTGGTAYDTATLSGLVNPTGTRTVTYTVYDNTTCTPDSHNINAGTVTVSGNGNAPKSTTLTFNTAGTYYWRAAYSGDANNNVASSPCNAGSNEKLVVNGGALAYTISGTLDAIASPLFPTTAAKGTPVNVAFNNPNSSNVQVSSLTIGIASVTPLPGHTCAASNFAVTQFTGATPLQIPPGTSTLQSLGLAQSTWPTVLWVENGLNQDGCEGATVNLTYTGTP